MGHSKLIAYFVLQSFLWGAFLGAVTGFLVQLALLGPVAYGLFGVILGFAAGGTLGIANGFILAILTLQFPDPLVNVNKYTQSLSKAAVGFTLVGSSTFFFISVRLLTNSTLFAVIIGLVASVFASLAAYYACQKVIAWHINSLSSTRG